ncbi:hypothetical protein PoB_005505900 [Plakobranchus ocellatus]|uniref:Uncharacterized protein n=1 Tax=Plakobranchus ocellatus TaxID=259542 RepID=A0AAV4CBS4_9GAST|nr:hypothetical protein PoB_005505900 [Plakobranchus ocellatus]
MELWRATHLPNNQRFPKCFGDLEARDYLRLPINGAIQNFRARTKHRLLRQNSKWCRIGADSSRSTDGVESVPIQTEKQMVSTYMRIRAEEQIAWSRC